MKKISNKIKMRREMWKLKKEYLHDILHVCGNKYGYFSDEYKKEYKERRTERYYTERRKIFDKYYGEIL